MTHIKMVRGYELRYSGNIQSRPCKAESNAADQAALVLRFKIEPSRRRNIASNTKSILKRDLLSLDTANDNIGGIFWNDFIIVKHLEF